MILAMYRYRHACVSGPTSPQSAHRPLGVFSLRADCGSREDVLIVALARLELVVEDGVGVVPATAAAAAAAR